MKILLQLKVKQCKRDTEKVEIKAMVHVQMYKYESKCLQVLADFPVSETSSLTADDFENSEKMPPLSG